eukprot:PITA_02672
MSTMIQAEPSTFEEVVKEQVWKDAMVEEYESIMKNDVWDVVPRSKGKFVVISKWLFKIKHGVDDSIEKYKARLKKALYGLKKAPGAWYAPIGSYLVKLGFTRSNVVPNLYFKLVHSMSLILVLYLDNLFLTSSEPLMIECKREPTFEFEMKDPGLMHYFLGFEVWQRPGEIFLSQGKYVVKLLERFGMTKCKSLPTLMEMNFKKLCGEVAGPDLVNPSEYRQLIGALMFLVNTYLDICYAVNMLSQFMTMPLHAHWIATKHILRYLHGTITLGLRYSTKDVQLHGYTDVDWARNVIDGKSTFGCCFNLGSAKISWMSRTQNSVALSTAEAEYIAASMASCEAIWLRKLFGELFEKVLDTTMIFCDKKSGICLAENPVFHDKSKHIEIQYYFI